MRDSNTSIKEVTYSYSLWAQDIEESTVSIYVCLIGRYAAWLEEQGRPATLANVEPELVAAFLKATKKSISPQTKKPYSDASLRQRWAALRSFSKFLHERRILVGADDKGVLSSVRCPKEEEKSRAAFTDEQLFAVLRAARRGANAERNHAICWLAAGLGIRRRELIGLELRDIEWDSGRVQVRAEIAKRNKPRTVTLPDDVAYVLDQYVHEVREGSVRPDAPLLLTEDGRRLTASAVRRLFSNIKKRTGIPEACIHQMRHTWATNFRRAYKGTDRLDLKRQGGWKDWRMVDRYAHEVEMDAPRLSPVSVAFAPPQAQ